jgi:hypothetical protein
VIDAVVLLLLVIALLPGIVLLSPVLVLALLVFWIRSEW